MNPIKTTPRGTPLPTTDSPTTAKAEATSVEQPSEKPVEKRRMVPGARTGSWVPAPKSHADRALPPAAAAGSPASGVATPAPVSSALAIAPTDALALAPADALAVRTAAIANSALTHVNPLGDPKNIDEAFDTMIASSSGPAEVRRHTDNVMAWNMKWDLVTKAQKTFDFSYFSIERDAYGYAYMGALLDATMRGVKVTGITDYMANSRGHGFVSTGLGADYMQELAAHGAKIGMYDSMRTRAKSLLNDGLTYKALSADHDKLAVADAGTPEAEGETGGRNVAGAYHQDPKDNAASWRDDSIQIKGPVTSGLVAALHRELNGPAIKMVKPDLYNFEPRATEMLGAFAMMNTWIQAGPMKPELRTKLGLPAGDEAGTPLSDADKAAIRANPAAKQLLADELLKDAIANLRTLGGVPDKIRGKALTEQELKHLTGFAKELSGDLELRGSKAKYDNLGGYMPADVKIMDQVGAASAAPGQRYNEMAPNMLHLLRGAQKEIVIQNPYVVLTEPMMKELEAASKRGVKITIVTNSPASTDSAVTQGFFLNDWMNLEARVPSARIFVATGQRKFHSKAFVLDGKVSGDTSYNADLLSGLVNGEVGAVTRSEASAQDLMSHIYEDLRDPANNFKEWTIKRDESGTPLRDEKGHLIAQHGPDQDISTKLKRIYKPVKYLCNLLTKVNLGKPLAIDGN